MTLHNMKDLLLTAKKNSFAVGYFEAWDSYSLEAVAIAAEKENSPVVLGFGGMTVNQSWLNNFGIEPLGAYANKIAENLKVPAAVYLNEVFELAPREVKIDELTLMKWDQISGILEIKIKCSAGTYIRAIARDLGEILNSEGCLLQLKRISSCGFHEQNAIKISDMVKQKGNKNAANFIIPTISALNHISTFVLTFEEQINFWQTGRAIKIDINYLKKSKPFDYKKPIKVIDKKQILLGIGFLNEEQSNINPKLVLNAK